MVFVQSLSDGSERVCVEGWGVSPYRAEDGAT
jgi:hypothetical protein